MTPIRRPRLVTQGQTTSAQDEPAILKLNLSNPDDLGTSVIVEAVGFIRCGCSSAQLALVGMPSSQEAPFVVEKFNRHIRFTLDNLSRPEEKFKVIAPEDPKHWVPGAVITISSDPLGNLEEVEFDSLKRGENFYDGEGMEWLVVEFEGSGHLYATRLTGLYKGVIYRLWQGKKVGRPIPR